MFVCFCWCGLSLFLSFCLFVCSFWLSLSCVFFFFWDYLGNHFLSASNLVTAVALVSVFFFLSYCGGQVFFLHNHMEKCNFTSQEYCMVSGVQKTVCMYFFHSKSERFVFFFFLGKIEIIFQFPKNLLFMGGTALAPLLQKKGLLHTATFTFSRFFKK